MRFRLRAPSFSRRADWACSRRFDPTEPGSGRCDSRRANLPSASWRLNHGPGRGSLRAMIRLLSRLLLIVSLVANASAAAWALPIASGQGCSHAERLTPVVHGHAGHAAHEAAVPEPAGSASITEQAHDCCAQPACDCGGLLTAALPAARLASRMPAPASAPASTPPLRDASRRDSPPLRPPAG